MYFYVDESGHTGPNLFDPEQPTLYYGVLSSLVNIDVLAEDQLQKLKRKIGVSRLHASELGNAGLVRLAEDLVKLQLKLDFRFDLYRIAKPDHAIICFFDQVFDQANNPAVTWIGYWTPIRYALLLKLASLFDNELAKIAWQGRIELNDEKAESSLRYVCAELLSRVDKLLDARSRQLITDSLSWAGSNPSKICYNSKNDQDRLQVMPNIVGFQSVMHGIASRLRKLDTRRSLIVVDQQSQFNKAQQTLSEYFLALSSGPVVNRCGLPEMNFKGMPKTPISFSSSANSPGLELVDIHLWIFKRFIEHGELAPELYKLVVPHLERGRTDEISLKGIAIRWEAWFDELPELNDEQIAMSKEIIEANERKRLVSMEEHDKD